MTSAPALRGVHGGEVRNLPEHSWERPPAPAAGKAVSHSCRVAAEHAGDTPPARLPLPRRDRWVAPWGSTFGKPDIFKYQFKENASCRGIVFPYIEFPKGFP